MLSKISFTLCLILMLYASFGFYPRWQRGGTEATISWDVSGYYWYLPSVFIYKDIKHQSFKDSVLNKYAPTGNDFQQAFKVDNGNYVLKYASGTALMYLPFFTAAHLLAKPLGFPADGFSAPYQFAIQLGGLLIALIGLWYLRKLLLLFYTDTTVAITLLLLAFGSNFLNYAAIDTGMSHCWLFTVYVFILLNTHYFYKSQQYKYAIRIGLLIGLATLTRPTEIISCVIPLLWGLENISIKTIRQRFLFLSQNFRFILSTVICIIAVVSIQLIYWKSVSGHWFVYSYQDQGFSWLHPHVMLYAFNYRSGWLTYTPMLIIAFIGCIPFIKKGKNKMAILCFCLLNYYIVSAWDAWFYGGRAMIQCYPVLLFPFASFITSLSISRILKWLAVPALLLLVYYNLWFTYQQHKGGLYDPDCMTKGYFWRTLGRYTVPDEVKKLKDTKDIFEGIPNNLQLLYTNNFESDTSTWCSLHPIKGTKSVCVNKEHPYTPIYSFAHSDRKSQWIRAQAAFRFSKDEWNTWNMPQLIVRFTNKGDKVQDEMIRVSRFLFGGLTKNIHIDVKIPEANFDSIGVFFWNGSNDLPIQADELKVWSFTE